MNDEQWHKQQDAKALAAEAVRDVRKSTYVPRGLQWLTNGVVIGEASR